ncbi:MAG: hypothetical protein J7518_20965 [Nocardioidaceae bacterium]|nr:hypothetical protein [Nocardioidaceae bacterium]
MRPGVVALVVVLLTAVAPPAQAGHGSKASSGDPDNGIHRMDRHSLTSLGDSAAVRGRDQLNRADDMTATFEGSGDVDIYDADYGNTSWFGRTSCPDGVNWLTGNCDVFKVQFNTRTMTGRSAGDWLSLGCHELGHTAGLGHRAASNDVDDNSCMRSEIWPRSFDGHDIDAINAAV